MWYEPPPHGVELCIMSITPAEAEGRFMIDMRSWYEPKRQPVREVDQGTIDHVMTYPHQVPMCPPGWYAAHESKEQE